MKNTKQMYRTVRSGKNVRDMSIDHRNRCSQEIVHENGDLRDEIVKTSTPDKDDNRHCKCVIGRKMMSGSQGTLLLSVDKEGKSSHGRLWMEDVCSRSINRPLQLSEKGGAAEIF